MEAEFSKQYPFIVKTFNYNGSGFNVCLTPELFADDDGLDFTGSYHCLLISSSRGTKVFDLIPNGHSRWVSEPKGIDPGIIDKLDSYIQEFRKG